LGEAAINRGELSARFNQNSKKSRDDPMSLNKKSTIQTDSHAKVIFN
jgi:hypothetical protein